MAPVSVITLLDTVSEHTEHRHVLRALTLRRNELEEAARILNTATVVCASILSKSIMIMSE
jgi:flagellar biosynthesis regulator FlbT